MISVTRTLVFLSCVYAVVSLTIRHTIPEQTSTTKQLDNGCTPEACEAARCIDPVTLSCCPECPNGENCLIEGQKVSFNEPLVFPDGRICYCVQESAWSAPTFHCEYSSSSPPPDEIVSDDFILETRRETTTLTTLDQNCRNSPKPDPCDYYCDCFLKSGTWQWECLSLSCFAPPCFDDYTPPGECCSICPNGANCLVDGVIIPEREVRKTDSGMCYCIVGGVQLYHCGPFYTLRPITTLFDGCAPNLKPIENACTSCECSENEWICMVTDCLPAPCVDSYTPAGQCCSVCPKGPNCREGGVIILLNTTLPVNGSAECQCVQNNIWEPPVAVCRSISTTVTSTTTTTTPKLIFISKGTTSKPSSPKPTTKTTNKPTT